LLFAPSRARRAADTFKDRFPYNTALMMDAGGASREVRQGLPDDVREYIPFYESVPGSPTCSRGVQHQPRRGAGVFSLDLPAPPGAPAPHFRLVR